LYAIDWKLKEIGLKVIIKKVSRFLESTEPAEMSLEDMTQASISAVGLTCRDKVIKVHTNSLALLSLLITSSKVENQCAQILKDAILHKNVILKLLQKSEEGNTRVTNKIHEVLLDLSFNPQIGEATTSAFIL